MTWIYLLLAGLGEIWWATTMKLSQGFSDLKYTLLTVVGMVFSMALLALALKGLPLSLAYPIWTGIGAVGTIIAGAILFGEHFTIATWFFVLLLIIGIIGIKLTSGH